jgi:hypothetical protein
MGSISIFSLDFSGTKFACSRDFSGGYRLQAGEFVIAMTPQVAHALADGGRNIRLRAQVAVRLGREMRVGAVFRRDLTSVDGRAVHVEIGVADTIDGGVYLEIGATRMASTDQQSQVLLAVLDQLAADVSSISSASEQTAQMNMVPALRGWRWPWEVDPTW